MKYITFNVILNVMFNITLNESDQKIYFFEESQMSAWEKQVAADAERIYTVMREQASAGRALTFSIAKLKNDSFLPRERIVGALVLLIHVYRKVRVIGDDPTSAVFSPVGDPWEQSE